MSDMYKRAYFDVQSVLDRAHGAGIDDGAGEGIAADVQLLLEQRDEARAEVARLRAELNDARFGLGPGSTSPEPGPATECKCNPELFGGKHRWGCPAYRPAESTKDGTE